MSPAERGTARHVARLITLTTDFGLKGPFVGVMKGAILRQLPEAVIVDLTHEIPAHWPIEAGFWLARSYHHFPAGTVHVAVVDPGVGTRRNIIAGEFDGHLFLAPDNGLLQPLLSRPGARCHRLAEDWRARQDWPTPSNTFHGRDIFAPLAAGLAAGRFGIGDIGPPAGELVPSLLEDPLCGEHEIRGSVVAIDNFGNLITNIEAGLLGRLRKAEVLAGGRRMGLCRTYGEARPGEFLALVNSFGVLEIARAEGNAADGLGLGRGAPVTVVSTTR
ncbi:MAG: SAM-dependent chlorinase/fluorinase [Gammaproteobacteria bacterium]|nr:SAM-dependent chlorinase/fluorinase [Gammaproteobacteria bacterium]